MRSYCAGHPPAPHSFPTRRSSDLIPDEKWGEVPAAYVLLREGAALTQEAIIAHCEKRLPRFKRPRLVKFVDDLDRKSTRLNSSHVRISYAVFCLKQKSCAVPARCVP